jgi:type II secretory pathway pseudopilin PulG
VAKTKYKAFSIIELLVAIALLVMMAGLASIVFSTTVKAHRKATASIEVARNLRVLTDQLTTDLRGLRKDAPLMIRFDFRDNSIDSDGSGTIESDEYDFSGYGMIHFFADGNFQTMRQYEYDDNGDGAVDGSKTIFGNLARVYYGHANSDAATTDFETYQALARKSHILTADAGIKTVYNEIPLVSDWPAVPSVPDYTQFAATFGQTAYGTNSDENELEFNTITLTQWLAALDYTANADVFIDYCMDDDSRPFIDLSAMETLHLLMAQGVIDFQVQFAYTADDLAAVPGLFAGVRWWPSADPAGDGTVSSDFVGMNSGNPFGVYFTLPNGTTDTDWFNIQNCETDGILFLDTFYPKALKFTFTLRDLNGIFEAGKTFTHIVYIDN